MIVFMFINPREIGDGDVDSKITPKLFSQIFIVVHKDSV